MVRYTIDGRDELEARIQVDMDRIRDEVLRLLGDRNVKALILGGAYGRGEGGILADPKPERPCGPYELFIVTPHQSALRVRSVQGTLQEIATRLASDSGVPIRIARVLPASRISQLPYELEVMELKEGNRILSGPPNVLSEMPYYDTTLVPMAEGARILLTRATALAQLRRAGGLDLEVPTLAHAIHGANRALGDAILFARRAYAPSYIQRVDHFEHCDLQGIADPNGVRDRYYAALHFELRPHLAMPGGIAADIWLEDTITTFEQVHLWFEQKRLNRRGMAWQEYMNLPTRLPAQPPKERLANVMHNVKAHGWPVLKEIARAAKDPYDDLMALLPRVLYRNEGGAVETEFYRLWDLVNHKQ